MNVSMIWRGDLLRALAATSEDQDDAIAELLGFNREKPRDREERSGDAGLGSLKSTKKDMHVTPNECEAHG